MKTTKKIFVTSIMLVIFSLIFSSCKKEEDNAWIPPIKEYFKCPDSSTFVTITDGGKVYELHSLGNGMKFIKFISGFPTELIGEELINNKSYQFYGKKVYKKTLTFEDWRNWFKKNKSLPLKNMGIFLLYPDGKGSFVQTGHAFVAWTYPAPTTYWMCSLWNGIPSEWLPEEGAYKIEIFCCLPIMDNGY